MFGEDTVEKKAYNLVASLAAYLPIENDRNRLVYCLYKTIIGQGDSPAILVHTQKLKIVGITKEELANKLETGLAKLKQ